MTSGVVPRHLEQNDFQHVSLNSHDVASQSTQSWRFQAPKLHWPLTGSPWSTTEWSIYIKKKEAALAGVAQLVRASSCTTKAGSFGPWLGRMQGATNRSMFPSHIHVSPSSLLSLILRWELKKRQGKMNMKEELKCRRNSKQRNP